MVQKPNTIMVIITVVAIINAIITLSVPARAAGPELAPIALAGSKRRRRGRLLARYWRRRRGILPWDGWRRRRILYRDRWWRRRVLARNGGQRRRSLAGLAGHRGRRRWGWVLPGHRRGWRRSLSGLSGNWRGRRGLAVRGRRRWCPVLALARSPSAPLTGDVRVLARGRSSLDDDTIGGPRDSHGELGGLEGAQGHEVIDF